MNSLQITETIARKVLEVVDRGLIAGKGVPTPGKMCVEAAVCFALGLPHGDRPGCVNGALRSVKIGLNDAAWTTPQARARGLRRLAVLQLGTAAEFDVKVFADKMLTVTAQMMPGYYRHRAKHTDGTQSAALNEMAMIFETDPSYDNARAALGADGGELGTSGHFAYAHREYWLGNVNEVALSAFAAALLAIYGMSEIGISAALDTALAAYAENIAQILIEMKVPGVQWLPLTE